MEVRCYGGPYDGMTINVPDGAPSIRTIAQMDDIFYSMGDAFPTYIKPLSIDVPIERVTYGYGDKRAPDEYVAFWPDGDRGKWEAVLSLQAREFELETRWDNITMRALDDELAKLEKVIEEL